MDVDEILLMALSEASLAPEVKLKQLALRVARGPP